VTCDKEWTYLVRVSYASTPVPPSTDNLARGGGASARKLLLLLSAVWESKLVADRFLGMRRGDGRVGSGCAVATIAGGC